MVPRALRRVAGKSLAEVLLGLASYNERVFTLLLEEVRGEEAFNRDAARCKALAEKIGAKGPGDAFYLLSAVDFFYSQVQDLKEEGDEVAEIVEFVLSTFSGLEDDSEKAEIVRDRLASLVSPNPVADDLRKLERLKTDLIRNGVGFSSFVDLRPDFAEDKSKIKRLVPIIIFRVSTDSNDDGERSFVFQLTEEALGKLKGTVEDAEKKLRAVRSSEALSQMLVQERDQKL